MKSPVLFPDISDLIRSKNETIDFYFNDIANKTDDACATIDNSISKVKAKLNNLKRK